MALGRFKTINIITIGLRKFHSLHLILKFRQVIITGVTTNYRSICCLNMVSTGPLFLGLTTKELPLRKVMIYLSHTVCLSPLGQYILLNGHLITLRFFNQCLLVFNI